MRDTSGSHSWERAEPDLMLGFLTPSPVVFSFSSFPLAKDPREGDCRTHSETASGAQDFSCKRRNPTHTVWSTMRLYWHMQQRSSGDRPWSPAIPHLSRRHFKDSWFVGSFPCRKRRCPPVLEASNPENLSAQHSEKSRN